MSGARELRRLVRVSVVGFRLAIVGHLALNNMLALANDNGLSEHLLT